MKTEIVLFIILSFLLLSCQSNRSKKGIVVISPEIAEILVSIAGDEAIVGVAEECNYPEVLKSKSKVGNFGQISLEKIIKLNPEIVITSALEQSSTAKELEKLGIKVYSFYPQNIEQLSSVIDSLGRITGHEDKAKFLATSINDQIASFKTFAPQESKRVFIEIYNEPLMSVSNASFVGQLLKVSGAENIFPILERDYCRVKNEDVIKANPDVIIITYPGMTKEMVSNRKGWQNINAVKNNKIFTIEDINPDLILRASPRIIEGIKSLRAKIYE